MKAFSAKLRDSSTRGTMMEFIAGAILRNRSRLHLLAGEARWAWACRTTMTGASMERAQPGRWLSGKALENETAKEATKDQLIPTSLRCSRRVSPTPITTWSSAQTARRCIGRRGGTRILPNRESLRQRTRPPRPPGLKFRATCRRANDSRKSWRCSRRHRTSTSRSWSKRIFNWWRRSTTWKKSS